jgi:glycosyltransferase involved in cell wall biosynthesis
MCKGLFLWQENDIPKDMRGKLFIVIGSLEVGGAEKHLTYVLPPLRQKGWDIHVLSLSPHVPLKSILEAQGVSVHVLGPVFSWMPKLLRRALRIISISFRLILWYRRYPQEVFHYFLPQSYILGTLLASIARHKGPRIMSRRSQNHYQKRHPLLGALERCLHKYTFHVLANSQEVMRDLRAEGIPEDRLTLIYNGVSIPPLTRSLEPSFTMMIVANLIPYKGHKDLFQALAKIKDELPTGWRLWIVGKDSAFIRKKLEEQCYRDGLESHMQFLGPRQDVISLWSRVHMGILCSHEEGFSNAILEAMAVGVPMVVTQVGGNSEAVIHGQTGYVVPSQDPSALAQAILALSLNKDQCHLMGQKAQERYKKHFTLEACVQAYERFYEKIASQEIS